MPRPKGAGKADPRPGLVSGRILDDILREYDSGELARLTRRIKRLTRRSLDESEKVDGCLGLGENAPPPSTVMANNALTAAKAIEALQAIRERQMKIAKEAVAIEGMMLALMGDGDAKDEGSSVNDIIGQAKRAAELNCEDDDGPQSQG